jgi:hypothetical protein
VVRVVVGPHQVVDEVVLLGCLHTDVIFLERREAVPPEVLGGQLGITGRTQKWCALYA